MERFQVCKHTHKGIICYSTILESDMQANTDAVSLHIVMPLSTIQEHHHPVLAFHDWPMHHSGGINAAATLLFSLVTLLKYIGALQPMGPSSGISSNLSARTRPPK